LGDQAAIQEQMKGNKDAYTIVDAPEVIGMHEHPTKAMKEKQL
jgi:fatty acid/phospholipid biosynthesis enzyme